MREVLEISPCITLQQFFSSGFLLKKLDMTSRVAEELLKLDKQLGGKLMQSIPRCELSVNTLFYCIEPTGIVITRFGFPSIPSVLIDSSSLGQLRERASLPWFKERKQTVSKVHFLLRMQGVGRLRMLQLLGWTACPILWNGSSEQLALLS